MHSYRIALYGFNEAAVNSDDAANMISSDALAELMEWT